MKTRATATLILEVILLPLFLFGPEQYGYAFIGLLAGLGAAAKSIGAESTIWMIIFPIATIAIIILFSVLGLMSIACLIFQIAQRPQVVLRNRVLGYSPVIFSGLVISGLLSLKNFPGDPVIHVSGILFIFPVLLLLSASFSAIRA